MQRLRGRSHYNKSKKKVANGNDKHKKCSLLNPRFLVLRTNPEQCVKKCETYDFKLTNGKAKPLL